MNKELGKVANNPFAAFFSEPDADADAEQEKKTQQEKTQEEKTEE